MGSNLSCSPDIQNLLNDKTLQEIGKLSDDKIIRPKEVNEIGNVLWDKFVAEVKDNPIRRSEELSNKIVFAEHSMNYHVAVIGAKPTNGYPVYICLHGGGGNPNNPDDPDYEKLNNSEWNSMMSRYKQYDSIASGIYIAPRGITNTWDLHFRPESYPMYDRLIENMVVFKDADPNKVYLLGYSAGGDGIYRIATHMSDRFAAANMSAGHPGNDPVSPYNLYNTPFNIQVGEYDWAYDRNIKSAEYKTLLDGLQIEAQNGYKHEVMIHRGKGHNIMDNGPTKWDQVIYQNPQKWLSEWMVDTGKNWNESHNPKCTKPGDTYHGPDNGRVEASCISSEAVKNHTVDTNAVRWVNANTRNPMPLRVRWNLGTTASKRDGIDRSGKHFFQSTQRPNLFYWLDSTDISDGSRNAKIDVQIDRNTNSITLLSGGIEHLRILLSDVLIDISQPIKVVCGQDEFMAMVQPTLKTMVNTLVSKGDKNYIFPASLRLGRKETSFMTGYNCYQVDYTVVGKGSQDFSDVEQAACLNTKLTSLVIGHGDILDSIQAAYGNIQFNRHGGSGGAKTTINFESDELIEEINGTVGKYFGHNHITKLNVVTNKRVYGPFGTEAHSYERESFKFKAPKFMAINSFQGKSFRHTDGTDYISALGVAYVSP